MKIDKIKENSLIKLILRLHLIELGITIFIYMIKGWVYVYSRNHHPTGANLSIFVDDYIPFIPAFVAFYALYYFLPQVTLWFVSFTNKKKYIDLVITVLLGSLICGICFNIYQVQMVRPDFEVKGIFTWGVSIIYQVDPIPINCFPSLHAYMGAIIILAVLGNCDFPKWMRVLFFICGFGIILSTVFIKQHYFLDMVAGVVLPILIYMIVYPISNMIVRHYKKDEK